MMKRFALVLALCFALFPVCRAEASSTDRFLSSLSETWDSFLGMAEDAGKGVSRWAEGALEDLSDWYGESGVAEWAQGALADLNSWYELSVVGQWTRDAAEDIRSFVEENRPAVEAWLEGAGEEVRRAWDTLTHPQARTREEVDQAYETVVKSLESAGNLAED